MPIIKVSRGKDGELMINNGVTRAARIAKWLPGVPVKVEVIDDYPAPFGNLPTVGHTLP